MTGGEGLPYRNDAGFTLIELIVALALFALISLAGLSLVETIVGVQQRTDGRADRLAEIQRAMYLVAADFEQLTSGPVREGDAVAITRGSASGSYGVTYRLEGESLHRGVAGGDRVVISEVTGVQWRFLKGHDWSDQPTSEQAPERPRAVELTIDLGDASGRVKGSLRRVLELPGEP